MSLINASNLSKSFGAADIFRGITFSIAKGSRLALVGPNGIGKTTLLRILVGVETASEGTISRAKHIRTGYLPQEAEFEMPACRYLRISINARRNYTPWKNKWQIPPW
jgi:ATP-binding cassette subfamily F protein 3